MTWREANVALQLLAEERIGRANRQAVAERLALEEAAAAGVRQAIGR